jgi:hypothetical protein
MDSEVLAEFRCCDKSFGCAFSEGAPASKAVLKPATLRLAALLVLTVACRRETLKKRSTRYGEQRRCVDLRDAG